MEILLSPVADLLMLFISTRSIKTAVTADSLKPLSLSFGSRRQINIDSARGFQEGYI